MTGQELVAFAKSKLGVPYVYGMKGKVMTEAIYNSLKKAYGNLVWDSDKQKIGKVCCDCSGLISWATGIARNSRITMIQLWKYSPLQPLPTHFHAL